MSKTPLLLVLLVVCAIPACADPAETAPVEQAPVAVPDAGWIAQIVADPASFAALMESTDREGWAALHRGEYVQSAASFGTGLASARAWEARASLCQDLSQLATATWERTFTTWGERSTIPADSAIPIVAGLAAWERGDRKAAVRWLGRPMQTHDQASAAKALGGGIVEIPGQGPIATRVREHLRLRAGAEIGGLIPVFSDPMVVEPSEAGTRTLHDPLVFGTLMQLSRQGAGIALGSGSYTDALASAQPPLAALLFSPWWSEADLRADLAATAPGERPVVRGPSWLHAGDLVAAGSPDVPDTARGRVQSLDAALDAWKAELEETASPEGLELLQGLDLVGVYRSQLLLAWARTALAADHPGEALTYAQLGRDLRSPRQIGPTNPPGLFVVMAHAELELGHTRQALDALAPLVAAEPAAQGLSETLGDLAVLEGMGRLGDSKEN